MKVVITIPTYNEVENIGLVLDCITEASKKMLKHDFFVLVVDANSPDGTGSLVEQKSKKNPNIKLLVEEEKLGLGAAYIFGFKYAVNVMDADVVIEMDGDMQHKPDDVLRLVAEIDKGSDYVIGSRFTEGGSIPKEWTLYRKVLSRYGSIFAKLVLGIRQIHDFTSGFKATRVKGFLEKIDLSAISSNGFAYKIELLYKMYLMGAKITEVPIAFGLRDRGSSKMEMSNFLDSFLLVLRLRVEQSKSFFIFLIVGSLGFIVDTFIFNLVVFLGVVGVIQLNSTPIPLGSFASLISGFIAMFVTYVLNNRWTFGDRKSPVGPSLAVSIIVYYLFSYTPILFRSWLVKFSIDSFGDTFIVNNLAFFTGIFIGLVWNFTVYSKIIWRKTDSKKVGV